MGVLSLILGVVAMVAGLIPGCSYLFLLLCCLGLIIGIIAVMEKKGHPGFAVAGIVCNVYATLMLMIWGAVFACGSVSAANDAVSNLERAAIPQTVILARPVMAPEQVPANTSAAPVQK